MEESAITGMPPLDINPAQAKPKRILWKWSLLLTILLLGYFMWQCGSGMIAAARFSDDSVRHFHAQLDAESYGDIVRDSDEAFQNSESTENLIKFLGAVHSKLGASRGFSRTNLNVNATTNGTFIRVVYQSTFDRGDAVETFTWRKLNSRLKLVAYDVRSKVFFSTRRPYFAWRELLPTSA